MQGAEEEDGRAAHADDGAAVTWLSELERLHAEATPGPWTPGHNPDDREPMSYIAEAYQYGPPGRVHLVCVPAGDADINDEALFTAITGNGPTSEANAALIAAARSHLPKLLAAARFCEVVAEIGINGDLDRLSSAFLAYLKERG